MIHRSRRLAECAVLTTTLTFALCGGCQREYLAQKQFVLQAGAAPSSEAPAHPIVLRVRTFRVAEPYRQKSFVYQTGKNTFKQDYYNQFLAKPSDQLTDQTVRWFTDANVFETVLDARGGADATYVLEAMIPALYGSYIAEGKPVAVLDAQFFLLDEATKGTRVVFTRDYHREVLLTGNTPEALVVGWNQALTDILSDLAKDLREQKIPIVASGG